MTNAASTVDKSKTAESMKVGKRLVELLDQGESLKAIEELYADTVTIHEAMSPGDVPGNEDLPPEAQAAHKEGFVSKAEVLKSNQWFLENHEFHGGSQDGPYPLGDEFVVCMHLDCTPKVGPMAGQRMDMKEACIYKVDNGKIVESKFCYSMEF